LGERPEEQRRRESQVRSTQARLANARIDFERHQQLMQRNAVTRAAFDTAETAYQVAQEEHRAALELVAKGTTGREEDIQAQEARVRSLAGRVVEANLQLQDCTLRAPYDGVIAQRFVEEGQNVRAKDPIVRFQDIEEIEIAVDVPETVMAADIRLADIEQLEAEISGLPGLRFPVRIHEMAQVADPTTQTFNVRVAMAMPPGLRILPGMTATVTMAYRKANILDHRIMVPITAISQTPKGETVAWVVDGDNRVRPRPVVLGSAAGDRVEVTEGLQPGDRVVTAGVTQLRAGMQVRELGDSLGGSA
jgi:RND family efflux transporter MFP subunit